MRLVYIAGPYRASSTYMTQLNIDRASKVAVKMWKSGYAVICPHKNTAHYDGMCEDSQFLLGYLEILKRCDKLILLPNWRDSKGTLEEIKLAQTLQIPIYVFTNNTITECFVALDIKED